MNDFKIVKYGAPHCGMCNAMDGILKQITEYSVECKNTDDDDIYEEASQLGIKSIPVTIIYHNDTEIKRFQGVVTKNDIIKIIDEYKDKLNKPAGYMYVFDYRNTSIVEVELTEKDFDGEDDVLIIDKYGFDENSCHWLFSRTKLDIIKHEN